MAETEEANVMSLTVSLLSAYFANNTVPSSELLGLVEGTRKALLGGTSVVETPKETKAEPAAVTEPAPSETSVSEVASQPEYKPAVTVEQSIASPDHILSLIDGKPYKALKRHLSAHNLTPAQYRERYKLPADYPMVAPGYSAARREVALKLGLGNKGKSSPTAPVPAPAAAPVVEAPATPAAREADAASGKPKTARKTPAKPKDAKPAVAKPKSKAANNKAKPDVAVVSPPTSQAVDAAPADDGKTGVEASATPGPAKKARAMAAPKKPRAKSTPKKQPTEAVAKPKSSRVRKAKPVEAAPAQQAPEVAPESN